MKLRDVQRGESMKAIIPGPVCSGCGYKYDPKGRIRVLVFQCEDGDYTACERCLEKVGQLKDRGAPDEEITALIHSFKDKE